MSNQILCVPSVYHVTFWVLVKFMSMLISPGQQPQCLTDEAHAVTSSWHPMEGQHGTGVCEASPKVTFSYMLVNMASTFARATKVCGRNGPCLR